MNNRFLFDFLKTLRAWRIFLPRKIKKFLPRRFITAALAILFLWFALSKIDISNVSHTSELPKEKGSVHFYSNQTHQNLKHAYLEAIYS